MDEGDPPAVYPPGIGGPGDVGRWGRPATKELEMAEFLYEEFLLNCQEPRIG